MFAVVETGGKQYKVQENTRLVVERLAGEAGDTVTLDKVIMTMDGKTVKTGAPFIDGASVSAKIVDQNRAPKVKVFKKKRRQNYRRTHGHKQLQTVLEVTSLAGQKKAPAKKAAAKETAKES